MFNIGPAELLVVLVIALLVLGPTKLPDAARQVGRALGEMRKLSSGFQAEMRDALKEPVEGKPTASSSKSASSTPSASLSTSTPDDATSGGILAAPRPPATDAAAAGSAVAVGDESGPVVVDDQVGDGAETPLPVAEVAEVPVAEVPVAEVEVAAVTGVERPVPPGPEPGPGNTSAG